MLKSLLKFLLAASLFFAFQKVNAQDETEPNNTAATANTLLLNDSIHGSIISGDVDWYTVTTNSDGLLRLRLSALNGADFYVTLYDGDGTTALGTTESYGNNIATLNADGLAQGTYYMQVYPYGGSTGLYTLADSLFKPAKVNDAEPNNYAKQALILPLNDSMVGHLDYHYKGIYDNSDWYKVTTTGDGLLSIRLSALNGADFYAQLYDGDSTTVLSTTESYGNNIAVLNQDGLAAGTYYIKLYPYSTSFGAYTLSDSLFFPAQASDVEPNNYANQALTLPLNSKKGGHLDYHYKGVYDASDWYKVTTNADGLLKITLSALNGADFYARLYDADSATVLGTTESDNSTPAVLSKDGLAAGTYYIQLFPYSTSFGAYTLSDTLYSPVQTNDKEPNNYAIQALKLGVDSTVQGHLDYYHANTYDNSDWYKITTPQDGYLRVTLSALNGADFYAVVYESDSTTQVGSVIESDANNPSVINLDGLAAGTYYIHLFPYSTSFGPYTLADSLFTYNTVDKEPNDSPYQAATIPANDSVTGHIDFYGNKPDHVDWWKINYTGANSGSLKINYTLDTHKTGGIGDIYFQVFSDTTAGALDTKELEGGNNTGSVTLPFIAQGYYYIAVSPYSTNFGVYNISDSFIQSSTAQVSIKSVTSANVCSGNSITYNISGNHSPYTVKLYKDSKLYDSIVTSTAIVSFTGLGTGNYYARAYADGATGTAYSTSAATEFLPPYPIALTTSGITTTTATLHWNTVSCADSYTVEYRKLGTTAWTATGIVNTNSLSITGLTMATSYEWAVRSSVTLDALTFTGSYSHADTFTTATQLPVTFVSFDGIMQNNNAVLSWKTADEINNKGFQVERSADAANFNSIGFVNAQYGHTELDYNFTDKNIGSATYYYRLKQIDLDGNFAYSKVIKLGASVFSWSVNGNPVVNNNSYLQLVLNHTATVSFQVISLNGSVLQTIHKGSLNAGNYTMPLTLGNVSAGTYIVKLIVDKQSYTTRVIKP